MSGAMAGDAAIGESGRRSRSPRVPLVSWLLLFPHAIAATLERVADCGIVARTPNLWQVQLGVWRMMHRVLFRSETIGTCTAFPVRSTWRARLLRFRAFRLPLLLWERAVAPLDFSGLASASWRIERHLLGAHHDGDQFVYDLQLLRAAPGAIERVRAAAANVVDGSDPRGDWLRDLVVFEDYHRTLVEACDSALAGTLIAKNPNDPDITFVGYLDWCARQPSTPGETWRAFRAGRFSISRGVAPTDPVGA